MASLIFLLAAPAMALGAVSFLIASVSHAVLAGDALTDARGAEISRSDARRISC